MARVARKRCARRRFACDSAANSRGHSARIGRPIVIDPTEIAAAFAREEGDVERVETHVSWVFLGRERVLKVKKPVSLGFLDFSTEQARRHACEEELRVNDRFAPGVYMELARLVRRGDGSLALGGEGEVIEHGVWMKRLPDDERADVMLAEGRFGDAEVARVAARVAELHEASGRSDAIDAYATPPAIAANVKENFETIHERLGDLLTADEARSMEAWQIDFVEAEGARFERRIREGRVRDGHGDLRLEHVYLRAADVRLLDAIEFSERFRAGDVAADVAFLSMELAAAGRVDLAERFLAQYARASNDFDLYSVVDFYEAYRACVRGKIALLRADAAVARRMLLLALACGRRSVLRPRVVAVGGLIASGKTTLADAVGHAMGAPVVDADRTRKHLVHVAPTTPLHHGAWGGAYALELTEHVYDEMLRRARVVLDSGRPVVVEASFRSRAMRARARDLARACGVPFLLVECAVPDEVCRARLTARARTETVSDGRLAIFDDFVKSFEPITELSAEEHVRIDGELPTAVTVAQLGERIALWPAGLTG